MTWLDDFANFAHGGVDEEIVELLNMRGVSDAQIETFCIGAVRGPIPPLDYPPKFLEWSRNGTKLDHMYCFPLTNPLGEIRGFQFRPIDRGVRGYQDYILESGEPVLFGLGQAMPHIWKLGLATIVEGPFDLFPIQRFMPGTFATLAAHVSEPLARTLLRVCNRVVMGYDNDSTGRRSTMEFVKGYGSKLDIRDMGANYPKMPLPNGKTTKDPGDMWEWRGDEYVEKFTRNYRSKETHNG